MNVFGLPSEYVCIDKYIYIFYIYRHVRGMLQEWFQTATIK